MNVLLDIKDLTTWYPIRRGVLARLAGHVQAVTNVSLHINEGETLALVGESGCGKSTLGRTVLGLERPRSGTISFRGQDITAFPEEMRRQVQIVFQDPASSLNPRMTILELLTEGPIQHGLLEASAEETALKLLADVGLDGSALHRYSFEFSGGQRQRIAIARALSVRPSLLVCDEAVSALDVTVQAQVLDLLLDLKKRYKLSYLFISHDLRVIQHVADRVAVMYLGRIVETGPTRIVMADPRHPYTQALMVSIPTLGRDRRHYFTPKGDVPSAAHPPPGCPFHTRCPKVMDICRNTEPAEKHVHGRNVSCHLF